jgi:hypothetical protein
MVTSAIVTAVLQISNPKMKFKNFIKCTSYLFFTLLSFQVCSPQICNAFDIELKWSAPTTNTDGTKLSNLAGYELHFGEKSSDYSQYAQVTNTSYKITQLDDAKTYYFAVLAYNSAGVKSSFSNELKVDLNTLNNQKPSKKDRDNDNVDDAFDNCVGTYNPEQLDVDADGIGDECDPFPNDPALRTRLDFDADGESDVFELAGKASSFTFKIIQSSSKAFSLQKLPKVTKSYGYGDYNGDGKSELVSTKKKGQKLLWTSFDPLSQIATYSQLFGRYGERPLYGCYFDRGNATTPAVLNGNVLSIRSLLAQKTIRVKLSGLGEILSTFCADIDNDGVDEVLIKSAYSSRSSSKISSKALLSVYKANGLRIFRRTIKRSNSILAADFDEDSIAEVAEVSRSSKRSIVTYYNSSKSKGEQLQMPTFKKIYIGKFKANDSSIYDGILGQGGKEGTWQMTLKDKEAKGQFF